MKRCAMYLVAIILAFATVHAQTLGVITECSEPGVVALTFDDGPSENTESLLDSLKAADVPATFFLLGVQIDQIDNSTGLLQRMYNEGHQLALHTQTHPDMNSLSSDERKNEMDEVLTRVQKAVDLRPLYMRPPFGNCSDDCVSDMKEMNYEVVIWNLDSNDWRFRDSGTPRSKAIAGTKKNILSVINTSDSETDNFISLQHDTIDYSVGLVPNFIKAMRSKGYAFSTVADCLDNDIPPYALDVAGDPGDGDEGDGGDDGDDGEDDETEKSENDANGYYGPANSTYDNSGKPKTINPGVSQKNNAKSSGDGTDGNVTASTQNTNNTNNDADNADDSGVAAIAPHGIIITVVSTMLVTMFAL